MQNKLVEEQFEVFSEIKTGLVISVAVVKGAVLHLVLLFTEGSCLLQNISVWRERMPIRK